MESSFYLLDLLRRSGKLFFMKVFEYNKCSTCQKALRFLDEKKIKYQKIPIVEQPPTLSELKEMLKHLRAQGKDLKNLFNTSGEQYRLLKISDKLKAGMTESEALKLLASNGKLIKRPFILTKEDGVVGFKPEELKKIL